MTDREADYKAAKIEAAMQQPGMGDSIHKLGADAIEAVLAAQQEAIAMTEDHIEALPKDLPHLLLALASDCDDTDGWESAADDLRKASAEITALRKQLADLSTREAAVTARALQMAAEKVQNLSWILPMYDDVVRNEASDDAAAAVLAQAAAAILALSPKVEGYVMVPVEPTEVMCAHGGLELDRYDKEIDFLGISAKRIYRAMIAKG